MLLICGWLTVCLNSRQLSPKYYKRINKRIFMGISFTNIRNLRSYFIGCESFLASNSPVVPALCEINFKEWTNFSNFSVRDYRPLIWKDSGVGMHCRAVYLKTRFPLARELSQENSEDSSLHFCLALLHLVSYVFLSITIVFFVHNFWCYFI